MLGHSTAKEGGGHAFTLPAPHPQSADFYFIFNDLQLQIIENIFLTSQNNFKSSSTIQKCQKLMHSVYSGYTAPGQCWYHFYMLRLWKYVKIILHTNSQECCRQVRNLIWFDFDDLHLQIIESISPKASVEN